MLRQKKDLRKNMQYCLENNNWAPLDVCIMDYPKLIVSKWKEESIRIQRVKQSVNFSGSKPRENSNYFKLHS